MFKYSFMKYLFTITFFAALFVTSSNAQEYVRLMEDQDVNFYDVQKSFNEHWKNKAYEKGKGWKQFKRWEYFMEPRVYPSGRILNPALSYQEYIKFKDTYASSKNEDNNKTSNWLPLGPTSWNSIGWNPGIGRINAITVDPNNGSVIYVGAPSGGCWKSTNSGASWTPLTDDLTSLGVSGIAIDPNNSNVVYLATGDGDGNDTYSLGVLKSIDGGQTFNNTGLNWSTSQSRVMRKIIIDPTNSNVLFVAASNGLWKTTDAGVTWANVRSGSIRDVEFNTANTDIIYTCTNNKLYRSTTGGGAGSFTQITNGVPNSGVGRLSIAVTADDANYVYLLASDGGDSSFKGLYRSTDGGVTFSLRTSTPNVFGYATDGSDAGGQSWYDMALAVSPADKNEVYTGGVNVWKSTDGGATLTALSAWYWPTGSNYRYVHADIHTLDFYGNRLFCGSDGGIFESTNSGASFADLTTGLQHSQFYRIGASSDPSIIMAGAQDNGCYLLKNGTWTHVTGADGMECIVDYSNTNIMYSTSQNGSVYKSTNGGNSFSGITGSIGENGAWVTPFTLDPVNSSTIYLGYSEVWKSTNGGGSWSAISSFNGAYLKSLVVAPSNNNVLYAATDGIIRKTTNGGANWVNISAGLPSNAITYISVHDLDPNILWVSVSGFSNGDKLYKSIDGGASWLNVSGNLPNLPINCVTYEYGSNNGVYVGTDMGVYYKNDDLAQWQLFMTDLPNVIVNELEIEYTTGKIRAATYGRGIWESNLFESTTAPIAQFMSSDTVICPGHCAKFINTTINLGQQWQWYFPGGTPSTSTDLNPTVCYSNEGEYNVSLMAYNANGSDSVYVANFIKVEIPVNGVSLPFSENFEGSTVVPASFTIINPDLAEEWKISPVVGGWGSSSSSIFLDNYSTSFVGEKDYFVPPALDFSNANNVGMYFDVAYKVSGGREDALKIYYSTDCGVTKQLLYSKVGTDLASTLSTTNSYFSPPPSQWRTDTVNLDALNGLSAVELYFENTSANGNVLYIDNINIKEIVPVGINELVKTEVSIYPNPVNSVLTIRSSASVLQKIEIYNVMGRMVYSKVNENNTNLITSNVGQLSSGYYILKITSENEVITKNLIKN